MSETTIPFQSQTAVLDRPPVEPEDGGGKNNRALLLALGGVAVALVLGLAAYFLLFSGSDQAAPAPVNPKPAAPAPAAQPPAEEPADTLPRLNTMTFGRDPFKALITEPVASTGGTTGPTGGTTDPTVGTSDPTGGTTGSSTGTPSSTQPHTFQEISVAGDNQAVTVKVDGKVYKALTAGEVFATYFKVLVINGDNTKFSYGDAVFNPKDSKILTVG